MKSTDHNLNNPLRIGNIDLAREAESWQLPNVLFVTQEFYDLIKIKDPLTIYKITDSKDQRMYYGDHRIDVEKIGIKYLIGPSKKYGEYILYMNKIYDHNDHLIEIARYDDPQKAINAMILCNNAGNHTATDIKIYNAIISFIDEDISLHDLLISFLCIFGYKEDPRLQDVIETVISYNDNNSRNFSDLFRYEIVNYANTFDNPLYGLYSDFYNVIVKYDFFKDQKYHKGLESLDLSDVINDIISVVWSRFDGNR